jgi:hypothetical protein
LSEEQREQILAAVRTNEPALVLIHSASNLLKARYPIDYTEGPLLRLPHLEGMRRVPRLLQCEALVRVEAGDSAGAADSVLTLFNLSRSLESEPVLMSQLVRRSQLSMNCDSLERVLCRASLPEEMLAKIQRELVSAEATNGLVIALIGERALGMELIRLAHEDPRRMIEVINKNQNPEDRTPIPIANPGRGWQSIGVFERDRDFYLRAMETNLLIFSALPPATFASSNDLRAISEEASRGYYILSRLFLPSMSSEARRDAVARAGLRNATAAVAIERWRLAHDGAIPDSLEALVPSLLPTIPQDPFDGQRLRFKKLSKGYVIYSIGPDFKDDGGKVRPPGLSESRSSTNRFDITFSVER